MIKDREAILSSLLQLLAGSDEPVGTRHARAALAEDGIVLSESTTSRMLRDLDERGWTTAIGAKGRVLTAEGRQRTAELVVAAQTTRTLRDAVDVRDVGDLLELLVARRAVESAVAGDAARFATTANVASLQSLLGRHRDMIATKSFSDQLGLDLHRAIAAIAPNRMLKTLSSLVLAPHLDRVEAVLDIVLGHHHREGSVVGQHEAIVDAIARGDHEAAEKTMSDHFASMIGETERYMVGGNEFLFERILTWMDEHNGDLHSHPARQT